MSGCGRTKVKQVFKYLFEAYPEPVRSFKAAEDLDMNSSVILECFKALIRKNLAEKVRRGWYRVVPGKSFDAEMPYTANRIRYPLEIWPVEKWINNQHKAARQRCEKNGRYFNLSHIDLHVLWESQNGRCKLTGVPMTTIRGNGWQVPTNASLDRINPVIGYTKDNVQFVCWQANQMKGSLSEDELRIFCKLIFLNHGNGKNGRGVV